MLTFQKIGRELFRALLHLPRPITFLIVFLAFFAVSNSYLDPDFGWHLASGDYFRTYGIPAHDIFTYTATTFPWIDHEWLSDVLVSLLYGLGGYTMLACAYAGLWTGAIWLLTRRTYSFIILLAAFAMMPFAGVRAITWSVFSLALLVVILRARNKRWRLLLPLLFLVWANLHGSFVIGFAYGLVITIWERSWRLALIGVISALATLLNPYGIAIYIEILRTLFDPSLHAQIKEWRPLYFPWATLPYLVLWVALLLVVDGKKWRAYVRPDVLFFIAALSATRNIPLFVTVSVQSLQARVKQLGTTIPKQLSEVKWRFVVIFTTAITLVSLGLVSTAFHGIFGNREGNYPGQSVSYLTAHPCSGRLFNHYDFGGYLIWKLPSAKVYIDGRMPSWEHGSEKYMDEYLRVLHDTDYRKQQFATYDIRCVVMKKQEKKLIEDLKREHWRVAVNESSAVLLLAPESK